MVVKLKCTLLLLICLPQYLSAQYTGGNSDGYSNNTLTQGACLPFSNDFMFYGSSGEGYSDNTLTQGACLSFSNDFMFYGSSGEGYSDNTLTQGACLSFSNDYMFYGSSGEGYSDNTLTQGACLPFSTDFIYYGASGDGYSNNTLTQGACLPFSTDFIYYGASGDGYSNNTLTQGACLPFSNDFMFYGTSGDGYSNNTLTQGACLPFSNDFMFYGGSGDGYSNNNNLTPTISISSSQTNLCTSGMSFSSNITNGGAIPGYQWKRNGNNILGETNSTYTATNLVNGDLITCQLTSNTTCASPSTVTSNSITVNLTGAVTTWLGLTNDWSIGSPFNWNNGYPSSNVTAIIPAGTPNQPQINDIAECFNIEIQAGASLTINAVNQLIVYGKFSNNGTFNAGFGNIEFLSCFGSSAQSHEITSTNGTTSSFYNVRLDDPAGLNLTTNANITGALTLTNGTFTNSASTFTLISNASNTARIAPVAATANFVGNITMQRFAPGPNTGWAHLGAPVQGVTLAQWQDDFMTSGFPGATNNAGGFISIWTYNESTPGLYDAAGSYIAASSVTNNVPVGKGFWVYLGTNTVTTNDITIDVTGQPTIGNFNFNPSYTNSGDPLNDGFNLIANPYPSSIDWLSSAWTKTNVNNAIYMYQADNTQYASFVGGIGVNGATRHIASSQGFYIQTNGTAPVLNISENAKSSVNAVLIKDEDPANTLRLKIHSDDKTDEMVIHLNSNATKAFDGNYDAFKFFNNNSTNPTISSIAANKDLSINSLPFGGDSMKVPVRVTVGASGMYHISWSGMNKFPSGTCFVIEDLKTGNKSLLDKDGVYYFTEDAGFKSPRFLIHITTPVTYKSTDITCSNINDGSVTVENNAVSSRKVILRDLSGNFVQEAIVASNSNFTFTQLASGNYLLVSPSTSICGDFNQMIEILPAASIAAKFEVSKQVLEVNEKVVLNTAQVKGNNLSWNLGDGNMIEGENSIAYQYQAAGEYTVTLTNTKGNCTQTESKVLTVKDAEVTDRLMDVQLVNGEFYAVFRFADITKVNIRLTNALGQEITETLQFEGKNGKVRIPIENNAVGVYMVVFNTGKDTITKKIVKN